MSRCEKMRERERERRKKDGNLPFHSFLEREIIFAFCFTLLHFACTILRRREREREKTMAAGWRNEERLGIEILRLLIIFSPRILLHQCLYVQCAARMRTTEDEMQAKRSERSLLIRL